jgi:hypothetical protein
LPGPGEVAVRFSLRQRVVDVVRVHVIDHLLRVNLSWLRDFPRGHRIVRYSGELSEIPAIPKVWENSAKH